MKKQLSAIKGELRQVASPAKAVILSSFFKTGKGQYGEGDLFLGVVVPTQRLIAKKHINATFGVVESLLQSKYHEERFTGLLILLYQFKKAKDELTRKNIYDFYLGHSSKVNNWDLVDVSCRDIVGSYLANKKRTVLYNLAKSSNMWERRIAIVSTMHFILQGDCVDALALS
ncbi:DNA alkylation repair protein, partial [Candidatus Falkowbacteria bacterium]|nr:DNA alkylation repair protein [Candidatus Falkowbacteria bacterium]